MVTHAAQAPAVDAVRGEIPSLRHALCWNEEAGPAPEGWTDLRQALADMPEDDAAGHPTRASEPALVYYTSGTAGPPKAVLHDHI